MSPDQIRRAIIALVHEMQEAAVKLPGGARADMEAAAGEIQWVNRTIVERLAQGRAPTLIPARISLESEEALDSHPLVTAHTQERKYA